LRSFAELELHAISIVPEDLLNSVSKAAEQMSLRKKYKKLMDLTATSPSSHGDHKELAETRHSDPQRDKLSTTPMDLSQKDELIQEPPSLPLSKEFRIGRTRRLPPVRVESSGFGGIPGKGSDFIAKVYLLLMLYEPECRDTSPCSGDKYEDVEEPKSSSPRGTELEILTKYLKKAQEISSRKLYLPLYKRLGTNPIRLPMSIQVEFLTEFLEDAARLAFPLILYEPED
jgi:hypothetical protein